MEHRQTNIPTTRSHKPASPLVALRKKILSVEATVPLQPVPFWDIRVSDRFWRSRIETNRTNSIPLVLEKCEARINNFALAGSRRKMSHEGIFFDDSDVYKLLEGIAYCLHIKPDEELTAIADEIVAKIASAQWEDGYINTYYSLPTKRPEERWTNLKDKHELYCAGHLIEAAIAYYQATGGTELLKTAVRFCDYILSCFGPYKKKDVDGHQEIEISLIRLFQATGDKEYFDLAQFFLEERGNHASRESYGTYSQDHVPVIEQNEAVGHAVRAGYMYSAMADIVAQTGNEDYLRALERIWTDVVSKKMYITGGTGSRYEIEGYGEAYELPNKTAYCETCAAIANIFWNYKMFLLDQQSRYIDILERILYNGFLAGVSLDGKSFFYVNPLEHDGEFTFNKYAVSRQSWFSCACCPTNVVRFMPTIPGYIFAVRDDELYVNLFMGCRTTLSLAGQNVEVQSRTDYPWDGHIRLSVNPEQDTQFKLKLRIPGWARGKAVPGDLYHYIDAPQGNVTILVNGQAVDYTHDRGYALIERRWSKDDRVEMTLPMPVNRVVCHENVVDNHGKIALERGPLVYCLEWPDNELDIDRIQLNRDFSAQAEYRSDLLNGIIGIKIDNKNHDDKPVYAIPYFAWSHRGTGKMKVWMPYGDK